MGDNERAVDLGPLKPQEWLQRNGCSRSSAQNRHTGARTRHVGINSDLDWRMKFQSGVDLRPHVSCNLAQR